MKTRDGMAFLVADHTAAGRQITEALRERGATVMSCHRGAQALDSVRLQPWDALIIGFRLVDMRGDAIAHAACAERPELAGRIVILTDEAVGCQAAEVAHFAWLPNDTPADTIAAQVAAMASR